MEEQALFTVDVTPDSLAPIIGNNIGETFDAPVPTDSKEASEMKTITEKDEAGREENPEEAVGAAIVDESQMSNAEPQLGSDSESCINGETNDNKPLVNENSNLIIDNPTSVDIQNDEDASTVSIESECAPSGEQEQKDGAHSEKEQDQESEQQSDFEFSESDSSDEQQSESSDSSSEDEDVEDEKEHNKENIPRKLMDDEDEEETGLPVGPIRSKNELAELPAMEPISDDIPETCEMNLLGTFISRVDGFAIVQCNTSGDVRVLDQDTPLFFSDRKPLGRIFDTFGPVKQPFYSVRMQDENESFWKPRIGESIFVIPEYAKFVFTAPIRAKKGTDASNMYDEEVGEDELEFSDDEKEAEYRKQLKAKKRKTNKGEEDGSVDGSAVRRPQKRNGDRSSQQANYHQQRRPQHHGQQQYQQQMPYSNGYPVHPMSQGPFGTPYGQYPHPMGHPFFPAPGFMHPGMPGPYMGQTFPHYPVASPSGFAPNNIPSGYNHLTPTNQHNNEQQSSPSTAQSAMSLLQFLQSHQKQPTMR